MKKVFLCTSLWMLSLLLVTSCKNAPQSMGSADYKTMEVEYGNCTLSQSYTAVINGRQSVEIRPQVSGIITKVCIAEGAKVHQDQVLFIIDQVPYKAALQTAIANVKSAEATVATARMTAESKEELCKEKVVSDFDLQTARNSLLEAEAVLAQAQAEEVNARNNLSYCFLLEDLKDYIEVNKNKLRQGTTRDGYKEVYGYLVSINDFRKFLVLYKDSYFQELDLIEVA